MTPTKDQRFRTDKGTYIITGEWFNGNNLIGYDIKNEVDNSESYVTLTAFVNNEGRIEYLNG